MKRDEYKRLLNELVSLRTVSPMADEDLRQLERFMNPFGFVRKGHLLIRGDPECDLWLYSHADTKPPGPLNEWDSDPFQLSEREGKWFGLGISDAKFQLLNVILAADEHPCHVVVDLMEECGGDEAGAYLSAQPVDTLIIVDGFSDGPACYNGLMGQADGTLVLSTGEHPLHPGRKPKSKMLEQLDRFIRCARNAPFRFHLTGMSSPCTERSLTMEELTIRFDIRFAEEQEGDVKRFLSRWPVRLKQWMPALRGRETWNAGVAGEWAPFSSPLGGHKLSCRQVIVCPGALAENENHRPNEFIYPWQVEHHQKQLGNLLHSVRKEGVQ